MANAKLDADRWFRCAKCGHKLGRIAGSWDEGKKMFPAIEIKCHSCKTINYLLVGGQVEALRKPQDRV